MDSGVLLVGVANLPDRAFKNAKTFTRLSQAH